MIDQSLIDYIKNQLKLGRSEDVVRIMLKNVGWLDNVIDEAFLIVKTSADDNIPSPPAFQPLQKTVPVKNTQILTNDPDSLQESIETKITGKLFAFVGVIAFLFGFGFFLKYIFERDLIDDVTKVIIGIFGGLTLLILGYLLQRKDKYRQYSFFISGGGLAILYLSIYGAFNYYNLISQATAFVFMVFITVGGIGIALVMNTEILAIVSLIGGFLTPYLVSTGVDNQLALFSYVSILNLGFLISGYFKKWRSLYFMNFAGTYAIFFGWFAKFYHPDKLLLTFSFLSLFFFIFSITPFLLSIFKNKKSNIGDVLASALNAMVYFSVSSLILRSDYHSLLGLFFVFGAIFYLFFAYLVNSANREDKYGIFALSSIGLVLLTLAIPIQLDKQWIAIAWSVEGLLLISGGFKLKDLYMRSFGLIVFIIAIFQLNLLRVNVKDFNVFFNERFITYLITTACLFVAAYIYSFYKQELRREYKEHYISMILSLGANFLMISNLSSEINFFFNKKILFLQEASFDKTVFKSIGLNADYYAKLNSLTNLKNLSLSIMLALYASILMIVGILKHYKSVRLFALVMFGIIIVKVFFHDIASLGGIYRIVSFMGLGAILLIISFLFYSYKEKIKSFLIE